MATVKSKDILDKLVQALSKVEQVIEKPETQEQFVSSYQEPFKELFVKLFVHARERNELELIKERLECAWTKAFPNTPLPVIPAKRKPLVIFPDTSIADAIALIPKHSDNGANLLTIGKYLLSQMSKATSRTVKQSRYKEELTLVINGNAQPAVKDMYKSILEQLDKKLADYETELLVKKAAEERMKERLKKVDAPNGAQQRALVNMSKKSMSKKAGGKDTAPTSKSTLIQTIKKEEKPLVQKKEKKRPMTDEEFEREFLKRARETSIAAEIEEERSRRIGAREDDEAEL